MKKASEKLSTEKIRRKIQEKKVNIEKVKDENKYV